VPEFAALARTINTPPSLKSVVIGSVTVIASPEPAAEKKKTYVRKGFSKRKSLVSLIKSISLKNSETKYTHSIDENRNMNHNSGFLYSNLLRTSQGISDTGTGANAFAMRIGDEVIARGISIKLWIANKLDRPNVMYRMFVFKYQSQTVPTSTALFKGANGNKIMDEIDKEYISVVYQKIFNLQVGYSATVNAATPGDTDGREAHTYKQIWIPLKNKRIHYVDSGSIPKFTDYGFFIVPYDSYGTLTTDNISSMTYQYKFYFKDP